MALTSRHWPAAQQHMYSNAPTCLEQSGTVSCAPPLAPSPGGYHPPDPLRKRLRRARGEAVWGCSKGGGSPPGEGARGGAQETAPTRVE
eukprot:3033949-Alexandrium_andersonii.AAC.1